MNEKKIYRTGDICEETGNFISESGQERRLQKGERFPVCPSSGNETVWNER